MIPEPRKPLPYRSAWALVLSLVVIGTITMSFISASTNSNKNNIQIVSPSSSSNDLQDVKNELSRLHKDISNINSKLSVQQQPIHLAEKFELEKLRSEVRRLRQDKENLEKVYAPQVLASIPPPSPINNENNNVLLGKQLIKVNRRPTQLSSSERLKPYVNKNYQVNVEGPEWSFDTLERMHKSALAEAVYPKTLTNDSSPSDSKDVLFVDGREQCENAREFLISVRQSGFAGKIVFLVYYQQDEADCQPLANDFQPMIIFYHDTPLFEPTMLQYFGVVNYAKSFPEDVGSLGKTIIVKPEAVFWCNNKNPFVDIQDNNGDDASIYGVIGRQTNVYTYELKVRDVGDNKCFSTQGRWNQTDADEERKHNTLVDSFVATSNFNALLRFSTLVIEQYEARNPNDPKAAHDLFEHFDGKTDPVPEYLKRHLKEMMPTDRYTVADCSKYLPQDSSCLTCEAATVVVGTSFCVRRVTDDPPNFTPYCHQPYREAIMEVPYRTTMVTHAHKKILTGAHEIRDNPDGIFTEAVDATRSVTAQCPHGKMGILSMMAGYDMGVVHRFIGSYLSNANPLCVKLIMIIKAGYGLENVSKHFPDRVEYVLLNESSEFYPVKLAGCKPADSRFEVAQRWLEKNYHLYRYVMAPDSRDYTWQADPLAQLIKILDRQSYLEDEFVGSVAEPFVVGGQTHPSWVVSNLLRTWISSCGVHCFRKMSKLKYTNGEPFAVLNSGHIIGTSLGLLHYFRFHVRMMNESGHKCDGTDQGLFTYYMYGMLQEAHFPHKVLVFSSSRSGFANMPPPARMAKRRRSDNSNPEAEIQLGYYNMEGLPIQDRFQNYSVKTHLFEQEYGITDCDNNIIAGLHQFDRHSNNEFFINRNPKVWKSWVPWIKNDTFEATFGKPS